MEPSFTNPSILEAEGLPNLQFRFFLPKRVSLEPIVQRLYRRVERQLHEARMIPSGTLTLDPCWDFLSDPVMIHRQGFGPETRLEVGTLLTLFRERDDIYEIQEALQTEGLLPPTDLNRTFNEISHPGTTSKEVLAEDSRTMRVEVTLESLTRTDHYHRSLGNVTREVARQLRQDWPAWAGLKHLVAWGSMGVDTILQIESLARELMRRLNHRWSGRIRWEVKHSVDIWNGVPKGWPDPAEQPFPHATRDLRWPALYAQAQEERHPFPWLLAHTRLGETVSPSQQSRDPYSPLLEILKTGCYVRSLNCKGNEPVVLAVPPLRASGFSLSVRSPQALQGGPLRSP